MTTSQTVLAELDPGVLKLTLNRPEKLNSFNEEMHLALRAQIQRAHDEPEIRAVLLTGAGRGFCAGQDLSDRVTAPGDAPPDLTRTIEANYNPLLRRLKSSRAHKDQVLMKALSAVQNLTQSNQLTRSTGRVSPLK